MGATNSKKRGGNFLRKFKKTVWTIVYILAILLGVYLIGRPVLSLIKLHNEIEEIEAEKAKYEEIIRQENKIVEELENDEYLEQYARENYFMQGRNEHVFIVEEGLEVAKTTQSRAK